MITDMDFYKIGMTLALREAGLVKQAIEIPFGALDDVLMPLIRRSKFFGHDAMHLGKHGLQHKGIAETGRVLGDEGHGSTPALGMPPISPAQQRLMRH
jgi:hypothetical protein